MSKLIKIFLITLLALAISCKSNEDPAREIAGENPHAGTYTNYHYAVEQVKVTINEDGSCTIDGTTIIDDFSITNVVTNNFNIKVNSWYKTYNPLSGDYDGYTHTRDYVINSFTSNPEGYTLSSLHWGVNSSNSETFLYFAITNNSGNDGSSILYLN